MGRGRYFCDYCDTFLTHDSPSVRKTHNQGRKHKENVRYYYQKWVEDKAQSLIDQTTAQYSKATGVVPPPVRGRVPGAPIAPLMAAPMRGPMHGMPPPGAPPYARPPPHAGMVPPPGMGMPPPGPGVPPGAPMMMRPPPGAPMRGPPPGAFAPPPGTR